MKLHCRFLWNSSGGEGHVREAKIWRQKTAVIRRREGQAQFARTTAAAMREEDGGASALLAETVPHFMSSIH